MEKIKENVTLIGTIIGTAADIFAISAIKQLNNNAFILISIISLLTLIGVISYLYSKYRERCNLLEFVEHLLENNIHKFTLLPKICLAIDSDQEYSSLHVTEMKVTHTYDFQKIDLDSLEKNSIINYSGNVEYSIIAKNKHIPEEFVCYLGNMYADPSFSLHQKHGYQTIYESVPHPNESDDCRVSSAVTRFSWQLNKQNISQGKTIPISFTFNHSGSTAANSNHTLVFYPRQYGKIIDRVSFDIVFCCDKKVLKNVEFYRIWKDCNIYKHTPISGVKICDNHATISFEPAETNFEAYYFNIEFELS